MRKIAEAEDRVRDEEAARRAEEAAAREAKVKADQAAARPAETRRAPAARAADPAQPAPAEDDFEGRRTRRRSSGVPSTPDRRPAPAPSRRGEQRRRSGKLTVSQALDERGGERSQSSLRPPRVNAKSTDAGRRRRAGQAGP